jgi:hypothetical protein
MPNAFEFLARDHEVVKRMLAELELGPTAASGADSGQLALRKMMAKQLVIEESMHEAVEEMHFWPMVREALDDGNELADQALTQEQQGKDMLHELNELAPENEEFETLLSSFIAAVRANIAFEEAQVWPKLQRKLSNGEAEYLGHKLKQAKATAPTWSAPRPARGRRAPRERRAARRSASRPGPR